MRNKKNNILDQLEEIKDNTLVRIIFFIALFISISLFVRRFN